MLFVREDILSNLLAIVYRPVEGRYVELNLRNDKWLINCSYNPHRNTISTSIDKLNKRSNLFSADYEKMILLGDFNVEVNDNHMKSFCENYDLKDLMKQPACYKNPSNPTYVVCCAIWYHLYNLKNEKNTHGGVLLLVKLQEVIETG